jgi:hypothetical protein
VARKISQSLAKFITVSAVTLGISIGLCGISFMAQNVVHGGWGPGLVILGVIEFVGMAVGGLGLVLGAICALIEVFLTGERIEDPNNIQPSDSTDKDPQ